MEKPDIISENNKVVANCNDIVPVADIEKMILTIRGVQVMNLKFGNRNLRHPIPLLWVHASDLMLLLQTALPCLAVYFVQKLPLK